MANIRRCTALNRDGGPCSATPRPGRNYCSWHDPELEANRQAGRVAGGKNKSNVVRSRKRVLGSTLDLSQIDNALCTALLDVLSGSLEPGIATAAAGVARSIATIRTASDLESRIVALEARQGGRTG